MAAAESSVDVAQHYNAVPQKGLEERTKSRIFYLRNFNNWTKSMLIGDILEKIRREKGRDCSMTVLDMCCGKGGDLLKWKKGEISRLVCSDVADVSLKQAEERYEEMKQRSKFERRGPRIFDVEFIHADLTEVRLKDKYQDQKMQFDLCSCQFSLHYSFVDEQRANCMLRNACECLKPGGYFIGTIPNANHLMNLFRQSPTMSYKNEVFSVQLTLDEGDEDLTKPDAKIPLFGAKFHFTLEEVVNLPEYLVYFPLLVEMLKKFDMELVYMKTFEEIVNEKANGEGKGLLARMQALEPYPPEDDVELVSKDDAQYEHVKRRIEELKREQKSDDKRHICVGTLTKAEWEVASLYCAFAFRKKGK